MSPATNRDAPLRIVATIVMLAAIGAGAALLSAYRALPSPGADALPGVFHPVWPKPATLDAGWTVFQPIAGKSKAATSRRADRYRLIGTFFYYDPRHSSFEPTTRHAIIRDQNADAEEIVGEGDAIGDAEVVSVFRDRVIVRENGEESELWLSVAPMARQGDGGGDGGDAADAQAGVAAETPFGVRKGERHFVLERDRVMDYYRELLDAPDRLLAVFDSLRPLYDDNQRITGYILNVEGEGEFFSAMGLREGDVVRKVNSVPMTNRRRAEYFIRQFVESGANAFVFDIERDGTSDKFIYQIQ